MAKYHIKKDGTPGECHATQGNCPLGGAQQHYETPELAQQAIDRAHSEDFAQTTTLRDKMGDVKADEIEDKIIDFMNDGTQPDADNPIATNDEELKNAGYLASHVLDSDDVREAIGQSDESMLEKDSAFDEAGYPEDTFARDEADLTLELTDNRTEADYVKSGEDLVKDYHLNVKSARLHGEHVPTRDEVLADHAKYIASGEYYADLKENGTINYSYYCANDYEDTSHDNQDLMDEYYSTRGL